MLRCREMALRQQIRQKDPPDLHAAGPVERRQAQGDVDAGLEGLVEGADAVGGEEEDPREVVESAEEDGDEGVALQVFVVAVLQEDVGFVEEEDGVPGGGVVEDFFEFGFEDRGVSADVAAGYLVEGFGEGFGNTFWSGLLVFELQE